MIDEVLTVSPGSDRLPGRHRDGTRDGKRTREENRGHRRQDRYSRPSRMNGRVSQLMSGWRPGVTRPVLIVQAGERGERPRLRRLRLRRPSLAGNRLLDCRRSRGERMGVLSDYAARLTRAWNRTDDRPIPTATWSAVDFSTA